MTPKYLLPALLLIILAGCARGHPPLLVADQKASVQLVKYACGLGCDAATYVIKTSLNELFTPLHLDTDYQIHQFSIKIRFTRTGKFNTSFTGPPYELIEIVDISR